MTITTRCEAGSRVTEVSHFPHNNLSVQLIESKKSLMIINFSSSSGYFLSIGGTWPGYILLPPLPVPQRVGPSHRSGWTLIWIPTTWLRIEGSGTYPLSPLEWPQDAGPKQWGVPSSALFARPRVETCYLSITLWIHTLLSYRCLHQLIKEPYIGLATIYASHHRSPWNMLSHMVYNVYGDI